MQYSYMQSFAASERPHDRLIFLRYTRFTRSWFGLGVCRARGIGLRVLVGIRLTVARKGMGKAASSDTRPPFMDRLFPSSAFQLH